MRLFALFGDPVAHSISPRLHNFALASLGLDGAYIRYHLKNGDLIANIFKALKLSGANVTIPHKEAAAARADVASEFVKKVGSANTLVLKDDKIHAFNTDAPGFMLSIKNAISSFSPKKALILGAGGTALALSYALKQAGFKVSVLNRSAARLDKFKSDFECFTYESFKDDSFDFVINTTSAGLKDELLPAPIDILALVFSKASFAFDVIYGRETPFLKLAKSKGLSVKNGADMLLFQAVLAFNLFFNEKFQISSIEKAMREAQSF